MSDESPTPAKTPRSREITPSADDPFVEPSTDNIDEPATAEPATAEPAMDEPATAEPVAEEPPALVEPILAEPVPMEPTPMGSTPMEPVVVEAEPASAERMAPAVEPEPAMAPIGHVVPPMQTVYVHAPVPPRRKGNRGVGVLIALASTVIFGILYAVILAAIVAARTGDLTVSFLGSIDFYIPVLFFAVGFILLVLIVNRAGWWVHIIGSLLVALFVYFGTVATGLLIGNVVAQTPEGAQRLFAEALVNPFVIAAGLLAREVAIWMGAVIAARGRRVKARNVVAREAFEADSAAKRAEYDRASAAALLS